MSRFGSSRSRDTPPPQPHLQTGARQRPVRNATRTATARQALHQRAHHVQEHRDTRHDRHERAHPHAPRRSTPRTHNRAAVLPREPCTRTKRQPPTKRRQRSDKAPHERHRHARVSDRDRTHVKPRQHPCATRHTTPPIVPPSQRSSIRLARIRRPRHQHTPSLTKPQTHAHPPRTTQPQAHHAQRTPCTSAHATESATERRREDPVRPATSD